MCGRWKNRSIAVCRIVRYLLSGSHNITSHEFWDKPARAEETFENSVESVWNAITKIEQMRKWYFENIPDFKPEVGFEVEFNVETGEKSFLHQWKITRVIPLKLIGYNWK